MGITAVVGTDTGLTISLTSLRTVPVSLGVMTSLGLNPADFQIIIAKGVHAPVAAYAPVCDRLIRVDTPGSTTADMRRFSYAYRKKPLYPFEEIE
jgi:microcystin degradation protein MlrC